MDGGRTTANGFELKSIYEIPHMCAGRRLQNYVNLLLFVRHQSEIRKYTIKKKGDVNFQPPRSGGKHSPCLLYSLKSILELLPESVDIPMEWCVVDCLLPAVRTGIFLQTNQLAFVANSENTG